MRLLDNKVVVVTGASRGIGRAVVDVCLHEGAQVAGWDIEPQATEELDGEHFSSYLCDITNEASVSRAARETIERFGRVDGLVNNAGITSYFDAAEMSLADWDHVFDVDLKGAWLCCRAVIPALRSAASGAIVNLSSIHARMTLPGAFPYAAAKAGLEGMTRSLALDLARESIRVNAVAPGYVRTEMTEDWMQRQPDPVAARAEVERSIPAGRLAEPTEIAEVVAFLLSDRASAVTGSVVSVDCGLSVRFAS